jgi:hypothetical protein
MGKKRPVRHARIAKKPLDPIEEFGQPFRIEPRREIAPGQASPQLVIVLLKRAFRLRALRQNAEIVFIDERSEGGATSKKSALCAGPSGMNPVSNAPSMASGSLIAFATSPLDSASPMVALVPSHRAQFAFPGWRANLLRG